MFFSMIMSLVAPTSEAFVVNEIDSKEECILKRNIYYLGDKRQYNKLVCQNASYMVSKNNI